MILELYEGWKIHDVHYWFLTIFGQNYNEVNILGTCHLLGTTMLIFENFIKNWKFSYISHCNMTSRKKLWQSEVSPKSQNCSIITNICRPSHNFGWTVIFRGKSLLTPKNALKGSNGQGTLKLKSTLNHIPHPKLKY